MNKLTFILVLLCIQNVRVSSQIFSEFNLGINYGDVYEQFTPLTFYNFSSDFGWKMGIGVGYNNHNRWLIKSGIYLTLRSGKGAYLIGSNIRSKVSFSFYEIPVIHNRNFLYPNLYFGIGIVSSNMISPSIHLYDEKTYQTDLTFHIRYNLINRINFEFSYMIGDVFSLFNTDKQRFLFSTANLSCNLKLFSINVKQNKHKYSLVY